MTLYTISDLTPTQVASICDHTFLNRPESYRSSAKAGESPVRLREQAFKKFLENTTTHIENGRKPYALCVRPEDVEQAIKYFLVIPVASVVGFPDGQLYATELKVAETKFALDKGAKEIDMVIKYDDLKNGNTGLVKADIDAVMKTAQDYQALVKLIFETSELTAEWIIQACGIAKATGVQMIKTSTGFGAYGAKVEDLRIMREHFSEGGVKISGGATKDNYRELLSAASGRTDGQINLDSRFIRIGESSLLDKL